MVHPFPVIAVVSSSTAMLFVMRAGGRNDLPLLLRAAVVVLTSQVAVGSLNDYADRHADASSQPWKPIPSGLVGERTALFLSFGAGLSCALVALGFGLTSLVLAVAGTAAGVVYDLWLKPTIAAVLAYVLGFSILLTWIILLAGRLSTRIIFAYALAVIVIVVAYLANSLKDIDSDAMNRHTSLAVRLGERATIRLMFALFFPVVLLDAAISARIGSAGSVVFATLALLSTILAARLAIYGEGTHARRRTLFRLMAVAVGLVCVSAVPALNALL